MSNILEKIDKSLELLKETKSNIRGNIEQKGVDVSDTDTFGSYAEKIKEIQGGDEYIVNMRLSSGITAEENVAGTKIIAVKTGELPTEAEQIAKIINPRYAYNIPSAPYNYAYYMLHFKGNAKHDLMTSPSLLGFKWNGEEFVLNGKREVTSLEYYRYTKDTALPLIFYFSSSYNYYCIGEYQDKEGNISTITFDVEPGSLEGQTGTTCCICSYDGKYIYAWKCGSSAYSNPHLYIYSVDFPSKMTCTLLTTAEMPYTYPIWDVCPSCNDYSFAVKAYSGGYPMICSYDEASNTVTNMFTCTEIGTSGTIKILSKDWCVTTNGYLYLLNEDNSIKRKADGTISGWADDGSTCFINGAGNLFISQNSNYQKSVISCPKDIVEPTVNDFGSFKTYGWQNNGFIHDENTVMIIDTRYFVYTHNYYTGEYKAYDWLVASSPVLINDDGLAYFYNFNGKGYKSVAPINGIYDGSVMESVNYYDIFGQEYKQLSSLNNGNIMAIKTTSSYLTIIKGSTCNGYNVNNSQFPIYLIDDTIYTYSRKLSLNESGNIAMTSLPSGYRNYFKFNNEVYAFESYYSNPTLYKYNNESNSFESVRNDSSLYVYTSTNDTSVDGLTRDGKYLVFLVGKKYIEIYEGEDGTPQFYKRDLPSSLLDIYTNTDSTVHHSQFFEDNYIGVGFNNGFYYLFKYTNSFEDLELVKTIPPKTDMGSDHYFFYSPKRKYWWYKFRVGNYYMGYAGKEETELTGTEWTAFPNTLTYYNKNIITGFLTGKNVSDKVTKVRAVTG